MNREKLFLKKIRSKNWKNSKNQTEIAACEQKPLARKRIFVQKPFSHYFKIRAKNFTPQIISLFAPFPVSAWPKPVQFDFKNHENVWTELEKNRGTSPDVQFKEFSLTSKKLDIERTMSEFGKPFLKKAIEKKSENNVKMPHVNKNQ